MKKYTVSTATLFNVLTGFDNEEEYVPLEYGGYIQKETDGDKEWFDLKTNNGTLCMDGETCELIEETDLIKTLYSHHLWVFGTQPSRNPTLIATDGMRILTYG